MNIWIRFISKLFEYSNEIYIIVLKLSSLVRSFGISC